MPHGQFQNVLRHLRHMIGARPAHDLSDRQLLERFACQGEDSAFTALVQRHGPLVRGVCWRVLRQTEDAEDVFQATFLVLARKAASIRWQESVGSWLYQVAYRLSMKARTAAARRLVVEQKAIEQPREGDSRDNAWRELCEVLDHELQRLPERCRAPLLLCYLDGKTRDEAAQQLGWSLATLKRRLEEGRDKLRERLARQGLTLSAGLLGSFVTLNAASAAVPTELTRTAARAGIRFAAGGSAEVSRRAATLAESLLPSLSFQPLKWLVAVLVVALSLGTGAGLLWHGGSDISGDVSGPEPMHSMPEVLADAHGDPLPLHAIARLGTLRLRHVGRVSAVAFAPREKLLASASEDKSIRLWDADTGRLVRTLRGHDDGVRAIAFAPDGMTLASGGYDGSIRLWQVATGKEIRRLPVGYFVNALAFSPDGLTLAGAGSFEGRLRLWNVATGKEVRRFGGTQDVVSALAFAPDGHTLASAGDDAIVRLWDTASGKERCRCVGHRERPWVVSFAPDGKTLVSSGKDATLFVWDAATGAEVRQLKGHKAEVWSVAFSPDGTRIASGGEDRTLRLWDAATGEQVHQLARHDREVTAVAFAPDGKTLAAGSFDRAVYLYDPATGRELSQFASSPYSVSSLALSPDGLTLATGGSGGPCLWDAATGKPLRPFSGERGWVSAVGFRADGTALVTRGEDQRFRVWNVTDGKPIADIAEVASPFPCWAYAPGSHTLALKTADQRFALLDMTDGKEVGAFPNAENRVGALALTSDGRTLAIGEGGAIRLRGARGRELRYIVGKQNTWIKHLSFSTDGRRLAAVVTGDATLALPGAVHVFDSATGNEIVAFADARADRVALAPDGRSLAWSGEDSLLHIGEVASGQERLRLSGHEDQVTALVFAADGNTIASGSEDTTVLIWELLRRRAVASAPTLSEPELDKLWHALASDDTARAFKAMRALAAVPRQTAPFLRQRLPTIDDKPNEVIRRERGAEILFGDASNKR